MDDARRYRVNAADWLLAAGETDPARLCSAALRSLSDP
jgi:hypothetical protein